MFDNYRIKKIEERMENLPAEDITAFKKELQQYIKELQELLKYKKYDPTKTDDENQHTIDEMLS